MKIRTFFIGLAFFILPFSIFAQQNFFNVPSSDITPKKKVFFQQQFNLSRGTWQSNSTLSIGLGNNMEIGCNILGAAINPHPLRFEFESDPNDGLPLAPLVLVNAQKSWNITKHIKTAIGTQMGMNVSEIDHFYFANYTYANLVGFIPKTETKIVGGVYLGNNKYLGEGVRAGLFKNQKGLGFQAGVEQPIIKGKLSFQADYISGKHSLGEVVIGGCYYPIKHLALSAGWQIPNLHGTSIPAGVIEITYIPL